MKLTISKMNKKQKIYLTGAVIAIIVIVALAYAYSTDAFLCRLTGGIYIGQAADSEQALNKLAVSAGSVERNNSPPLSYMAFNESRSERLEIRAWLNSGWPGGEQTTIRGFVIDAPYRTDKLNYGDGYFISDAGDLYKLSSPRC